MTVTLNNTVTKKNETVLNEIQNARRFIRTVVIQYLLPGTILLRVENFDGLMLIEARTRATGGTMSGCKVREREPKEQRKKKKRMFYRGRYRQKQNARNT